MPTDHLDAIFGPRMLYAEQSPQTTKWPKAPERLRKFLDAYEEWTGFHPQGGVRTLWITGATDWVDNFGERSLGTFKAAMDYCDEHGLRPKSPKGLIFYGLQFGVQTVKFPPCPECGEVGGHAEDCPEVEE